MTIFYHPCTDIEKLSIVTPFEPNNFLQQSDQGSPFTLGGKGEKKEKREDILQEL